MDATTLYSTVLDRLNRTIVRMTSAEFDALLQRSTSEERQRAMRELLDVQQARLVLGNAILTAIAEEMKANEQAFEQGIADLDTALARLERIETILTTVNKFVGVVGRVVALV